MRQFLLIAVAVFAALNAITIWQLIRLHGRRKTVIAIAAICNLMWLFLPWLNARTDFSRAIRATLGPPWFAWLCFVLVYSAVLFLLYVARTLWSVAQTLLSVAQTLLSVRTGKSAGATYNSAGATFSAFARWPSRIFLWATLIAIPIGVYTALVPVDVERVPVAIAGAPNARIVVMADLHIGLYTRPSRLRRLFAKAQSLNPDVIVLAGDLIDDDPYFVPKLLDGVRDLRPDIPLLAVMGNHEMYGQPLEAIARLRGSRVHLLVNEGVSVGVSGSGPAAADSTRQPATGNRELWIAGVSDYAATLPELRPNLDRALAGQQGFPVVVAHQPKVFDEVIARKLPLALVAHTHGGQFGFRALHWSLAGLFLPYHMGLYRRGASMLYVNTGTGFWLLPWRIGVIPEITLVELRPSLK